MGNVIRIVNTIYRQPLQRIVIWIILLILLWALLRIIFKTLNQQIWHLLNILVLAISLFVIIYITLYNRSESTNELVLIPFYSFKEAKIQPEFYRSMLMNVFLFVPLGLSLPNAVDAAVLSQKRETISTVRLTIVIGFLLSATIEYLQYRYSLGRCEVDDVIMNTLGTVIGASSFVIKVPKRAGDRVRKNERDK